MVEKWRPIPGFESFYEVSDQGRVRSLDRVIVNKHGVPRRLPGRLLTPSATGHGYLVVKLSREGTSVTKTVHRQVLLAFVGPCPEGLEACHGPGGQKDNQLSNLRYGTHEENMEDRRRDGYIPWSKTHCKRDHEFKEGSFALQVLPNGSRRRFCLACRKLRWRK